METLIGALLAGTLLTSLCLYFRRRMPAMHKSLILGSDTLSQWLPLVSSVVILFLVLGNIAGRFKGHALFDLSGFLNRAELAMLLVLSPLLLFRAANIVALFGVSYFFSKIMFNLPESHSYLPSVMVLLSCLGIIMALGDKYPWIARDRKSIYGQKFRTVLLLGISIVSFITILVTMFRINQFTSWTQAQLSIDFSPFGLFLLMGGVLICWMTIAFGMGHPLLLALLATPTIVAQAYLTGWPLSALVVGFICSLALSVIPLKEYMNFSYKPTNY